MATPTPLSQGDWSRAPVIDGILDVSGGVYSAVEPYQLENKQLAYAQNVDFLTKPGARRRRLGCEAYGAPGATPCGIAYCDYAMKATGQPHLVGVWNGQVWESPLANKTWEQLSNSSISLPASTLYRIVQGQSTEYHGPPTSVTEVHTSLFLAGVYPWTGASNTALFVVHHDGDCTGLSLYPRAIEWWQGRLWMFGFRQDGLKTSTLMWSTILDGWDVDITNSIDIAPDDGDEGMAIVPARGSAPRLYLFKKRAIYALDVVWGTGQYIPGSENSLDTANSRLVLVSENVGCVAPRTVVHTSGSSDADIFFLAHDGFRSLRRVEQDIAGGAGLPISAPIQDVMDRINWSYAYLAVAAVWDNQVFLSVPLDGATANNTTLVFSLETKTWQGIYTWALRDALVAAPEGEMRFYVQWPVVTGETLAALGYTTAAHVFRALSPGIYRDPSYAAIEYDEQSRAFLFDEWGGKKRWDWVEYIFEPADTATTIEIQIKIDEGDWASVDTRSIVGTYDYPVLPAQLPWNFQAPAVQVERIGLMDVPAGRRAQLRIVSSGAAAFGIRSTRFSAWPMPELWE